MYVLLDTNVWLAALAHDGACRRVVDAAAPRCTFVITPFLRAEVEEKLVAKFKRTAEQARELVTNLASRTLLRDDVKGGCAGLRDPDDEPVLAAATAHGCDFLVTGDKDLLEVSPSGGVEIITVREFARRLGLEAG